MKIQMVDLLNQYLKIRQDIDSGIEETIQQSSYINGPSVVRFRDSLAKYLNVSHVIACANGTDALQVALMALGLQRGDEVITPDFTFVATAEAIALLGGKPVPVDVHPDTFTIDPQKVAAAITPRTKAIIPVHLFGQAADMNDIMQLANQHHLHVIEDNAQAIGAEYQMPNGDILRTGCIGDIGTTSFFPSKNLGCFGDGGAITTNDTALAERMSRIVNHGSRIKYHHEEIGINSRLDTLQAAILLAKLPHLDAYNQARQRAADGYDELLGQHEAIRLPVRASGRTHVFHQYTIRILNGKRNYIREQLAQKGIPSMIYYPVPISQQKAFSDTGSTKKDLEVSEKLCNEVLSLPMHTELSRDQQEYIAHHLLKLL